MSKLADVMRFDEERTGTVPRKNWRKDERFDWRNAFDMFGEPLPATVEFYRSLAERAAAGVDDVKETVKKVE